MKSLKILIVSMMLAMTAINPVYATEMTSKGTGSSDAVLNTEAASFSVTVPVAFPIHVDSTGIVTVSNETKIVNHSYGSVQITGASIEGFNGWSIINFDSPVENLKVNSKQFGFMLQEGKTVGGVLEFIQANYPVLAGSAATNGSNELPLVYDAVVAPQKSQWQDEKIADVVFTIGWYGNESPVYEDGSILLQSDESVAQEQIQTFTVAGLQSIKNITSDTGDVEILSINGDQVTVKMTGGNSHKIQTGGEQIPADTKLIENYKSKPPLNGATASVKHYLYADYYNDNTGEWDATVPQIQWSGGGGIDRSYTPIKYNIDGYVGNLYSSTIMSTIETVALPFAEDIFSKIVNDQRFNTLELQAGSISIDGYSGTLKVVSSLNQIKDYNYGKWMEFNVNLNTRVNPLLNEMEFDDWKGTVTKPAQDTRTYEDRYQYNLTVEYYK